jgi:chromate transporter
MTRFGRSALKVRRCVMAKAASPMMAAGAPSLSALFLCFAKVAVTSFGGGLSGWLMHEIVRRRGWVGEEEFLIGLAISQALPGVNVVNLPIWLGFRLRGGAGALVSALGMVVPPMLIIIAVAALYETLAGYPETGLALAGAAASAIGMALAMALRAARRNLARAIPAVLMLAVFVSIGLLRLPLLPVVLVAAPVSIALAWRRLHADV